MSEKWLPIESAPKDGTKIVLGGPTWVDVGSWDDWYDQSAPGWFSETNHNGYISAGLDPTHWMPLPPPPGSET